MTTRRIGVFWLVILGGIALAGTGCQSTNAFSFPPGDALGMTKAKLNRSGEVQKKKKDWVFYSETLRVRFKDGKVAEVREKTPEGLSCKEAARWMGFKKAHTPILKPDRCIWPARSPEHGLGAGVSGTFRIHSHQFHVKHEP